MDVALLSKSIDELIYYAIDKELLVAADALWARNRLLALAECDLYVAPSEKEEHELPGPDTLLANFAFAAGKSASEIGYDAYDQFCCHAMNILMPRPSEVSKRFDTLLAQEGPRAACDYLYGMSCKSNYVHVAAIKRNISWITPSPWGNLEITINLSKPEKDPAAIAKLAAKKEASESAEDPLTSLEPYPACQLCLSNEGYEGRFGSTKGNHPARQNLRIAHISLGGEEWGLQFSPYSYYDQHCIAINHTHIPMHIDQSTFERLLDFVDLFPHYFIGSNADLPIVGGSILNHDHFQAGHHRFPMEKAPITKTFTLEAFPTVSASIVSWPLSVLRLESQNRDEMLHAATHILETWRSYSDPAVGIFAKTGDTLHNTITPIARRVDGEDGSTRYILHLALRCNITSDEHPLGVFHPHAHLHHIKKENIGLIEVMGLAILPGRLSRELDDVKIALLNGLSVEEMEANPLIAKHAIWASKIAADHRCDVEEEVAEVLHQEVGNVFCEVLECAGVFKWDDEGRKAFDRFIDALA